MLTTAELSALRDHAEQIMGLTGYILRGVSGSVDSYGFPVILPIGTAGTTIAHLAPDLGASRAADIQGGQQGDINYYWLTVPYDTDLRVHDKISIGSDEYAVLSLADDHPLRAARRALVSKRE